MALKIYSCRWNVRDIVLSIEPAVIDSQDEEVENEEQEQKSSSSSINNYGKREACPGRTLLIMPTASMKIKQFRLWRAHLSAYHRGFGLTLT